MRSKIPAHFYRAERGREIDFTLYFELYIQLMRDQYGTIRICSIDDLGNTRMRILSTAISAFLYYVYRKSRQ